MIRYQCEECGAHTRIFGMETVPEPALCLQCAFIASMELAPDEEKRLREFLHADE